jgi:SAM-dependent methyltransferase
METPVPESMSSMDWTRLSRLWAYPGRNVSARARWEYIGRSASDAFHMMDGSTSEEDLHRRGEFMANLLAVALEITPRSRVLEVGCGVARVGREMAPRCAAWTGADISRSLLRHARRRTAHLTNVDLRHLAGEGLEGLPDAAWDRLYCHKVLLHVDEPGIAVLLRDIRRVLQPHGLAYLDVWNGEHADVQDLARREQADPVLRRQPHRSRFYTRGQVQSWLTAAGLQPVWIADSSFLIQVISARSDADPEVVATARHRLDQHGSSLIPRGDLDFTPPAG